MLTYREGAPATQAELDQAGTASQLVKDSRCVMILSALQIALAICCCTYMGMDDTVDGKASMLHVKQATLREA